MNIGLHQFITEYNPGISPLLFAEIKQRFNYFTPDRLCRWSP